MGLVIELRSRKLDVEVERTFVVLYDGQPVGRHRPDLVVEGRVIVEVKTVEHVSRSHYAQARSYLRATGLDTALLVNFAGHRTDYRRIELPIRPVPGSSFP